MLGWVTPNLSILFLKTSKADVIDSSILVLKIGFTSSFDIWKFISSLRVLFANTSGDARFASSFSSKAMKKDSRYVSFELF